MSELSGLPSSWATPAASSRIDEVRSLVGRGYRDTRPMKSVGYREVLSFVEGELPEAELRDAVVRSTRVFVRRQRTWLRDQAVTYVAMD